MRRSAACGRSELAQALAQERRAKAALAQISAILAMVAALTFLAATLAWAGRGPVRTEEDARRAEPLVAASAEAAVLSMTCEREASGFARAARELALGTLTELLGSRDAALLTLDRARVETGRHFDAIHCAEALGAARDRIELERAKWRLPAK